MTTAACGPGRDGKTNVPASAVLPWANVISTSGDLSCRSLARGSAARSPGRSHPAIETAKASNATWPELLRIMACSWEGCGVFRWNGFEISTPLGQELGIIDKAWSYNPQRFWLHTRTLDHPAALPNYRKAGLVASKEEIKQREIGRRFPGLSLRKTCARLWR
jgi:hypothetical protein